MLPILLTPKSPPNSMVKKKIKSHHTHVSASYTRVKIFASRYVLSSEEHSGGLRFALPPTASEREEFKVLG